VDTLEAIETRRSVKHYDPTFAMPEEDVQTLLSSAMLSPTSFNVQHWRFVLVRDPEIRRQIREAAWDQAQVTEASLLLVLCGDAGAWEKDPARYWKTAPEEIQSRMAAMIVQFYEQSDTVQRDEVMRSCGIAAQTLMLAAKALGYDSGPMIGFDADKVAEIIRLPDDHVIAMLLVIGKPLQPARPRGGQLPMSDVVIEDRFPPT
jgi:nitroreductase